MNAAWILAPLAVYIGYLLGRYHGFKRGLARYSELWMDKR